MDADRELKADRALRDLFREVGHKNAPAGIDARIIGRIAATTTAPAKPVRSLVPPFAWVAAGAALIALTTWLMANASPADGSGYLNDLIRSLPQVSLAGLFSSKWVMMGGASVVALLGFEALLSRRTSAIQIRG